MAEKTLGKNADGKAADRKEKRESPRYPFSQAAEVVDIEGNTKITARLSDIAKKGCYVDTISPFAAKAAVALKITKDNQSFETKATVVYSQIGMGMGLLFTSAAPEQRRMLEIWLSELSGEKLDALEERAPTMLFEPAKMCDEESRGALSELILLLSRKGILSDAEGHAILQRFFK